MGSLTSPNGSASGLRHMSRGFACATPYALTPGQPPPGTATLLRLSPGLPTTRSVRPLPSSRRNQLRDLASRIQHGRPHTGTGISTRYPSTTPVGLALGPDSPWADEPSPGTLGHPAEEILTLHSLLMPAFSLPHTPPQVHTMASPHAGRSPTQQHPSPERPMSLPQLRRCA